jgi:hypothetical protein
MSATAPTGVPPTEPRVIMCRLVEVGADEGGHRLVVNMLPHDGIQRIASRLYQGIGIIVDTDALSSLLAAAARVPELEAAAAVLCDLSDERVEQAHWECDAAARGEFRGRPERLESSRAVLVLRPNNPGLPSPLARLREVLADALKQADGDEQEFIEKMAAEDFEHYGLGPRDDEGVPEWADRIREEASLTR